MLLKVPTVAALLTLGAAPTASFLAPGAASRVRSSLPPVGAQKTTSTTLHYRDDVPPIGSAPHRWETPNDFDQFLTQCAIQSFAFLLNSLRDDVAVRWLDDFTRPVLEKHGASTTGSSAGDPAPERPLPPPKVSLTEAARTALAETDKALRGEAVVPPEKNPEKAVQSKNEPKNDAGATDAGAAVETKAKKAGPPKEKEAPEQQGNKTMDPVPPDPPPSGPVIYNTGTDQLYSSTGLPTQRDPPIVRKPSRQDRASPTAKKNFSPFVRRKPKAAPPSPRGLGKTHRGVPFFYPKPPRNGEGVPQNGPGGFAPVPSTSSLYGGGGGENTKARVEEGSFVDEEPVASPEEPKRYTASVLKYHGLGVLNNTEFPTWDSYFEKMLDQPKEFFWVESFHHPRAPGLELDVDPASLCRRMIAVRSQIAAEFEHDLEVVADMGERTLTSYHKMLEEIREQRAEEELQQNKDDLETLMDGREASLEDALLDHNGAKSTDDVDAPRPPVRPRLQRASLLFLDRGVGGGAEDDDEADRAPSPLRKGNFDLLCLLATQEGIHRVLNDPSRGRARESPEHGNRRFLQDFYLTRLLSHFSGDQRFGRADDFLEELLRTPAKMITVGGNASDDEPEGSSLTKDTTYLVDPVMVADAILKERAVVALEWKRRLAERAKEDHAALQRMVLAKAMSSTADECDVVGSDGKNDGVEDTDFDSCFE